MIKQHSQIWTTNTICDIHSRADGDYRLSNFKPFHEIASFDELVFLASGLTRFPLEGYKEKCKTETVLGSRFSKRPLVIDTPVYVQADPTLPDEVRAALSKGASLATTALSTGGKLTSEERQYANKLIYEISSEDFDSGGSPHLILAVKSDAIQINVSYQTTVKKLGDLIKSIRKETERKVPIFVSMPAGKIRDDVRAAAKAGADVIVLQGLKSSTTTDRRGVLNYSRMPMASAIAIAREALIESRLLGEVDLVSSSGIRNGADAAKALALGASAVVINESALIALSYPPAVVEFGTKDEKRDIVSEGCERQLDTTGERLAKFINSTTMEIALLARSLAKGDVHSLEFEDLSALTVEASMLTGIRLSGE